MAIVINATVSSNYYFEESDKEIWKVSDVDFYNCAPLYEFQVLEFEAPNYIRSKEEGINSWSGPDMWWFGVKKIFPEQVRQVIPNEAPDDLDYVIAGKIVEEPDRINVNGFTVNLFYYNGRIVPSKKSKRYVLLMGDMDRLKRGEEGQYLLEHCCTMFHSVLLTFSLLNSKKTMLIQHDNNHYSLAPFLTDGHRRR